MDSGRTELTDSLIASDLTEPWELGHDHHSLAGHHARHPAGAVRPTGLALLRSL